MKNPKTFVFLAFVLLFHLAFVSCKSIQKEPVVSECKLCSPEAKAKRQAWIASLSKKHLLASDDDDDDDKEHSLDIEQYHRHLRNTIRRMTKLEALCQCNPFEGDQLDAFSEIPFRKTLLFKNLQVLDQLTNKNRNLALRSLFVYQCLQFEDLESFSPCIDDDLAEVIPKDILHDSSFKRFLFENSDSTLSTIAVLDDLVKNQQTVVVIPHYKNKPVVFQSRLSISLTEEERKWLAECTLNKNIIKTLSDLICTFEKPITEFGPAMFTDFYFLLDINDLKKFRIYKKLNDDDEKSDISNVLPCWYVKASTYATLSSPHIPVEMWLGPCYEFILNHQKKTVDYVRRTK